MYAPCSPHPPPLQVREVHMTEVANLSFMPFSDIPEAQVDREHENSSREDTRPLNAAAEVQEPMKIDPVTGTVQAYQSHLF